QRQAAHKLAERKVSRPHAEMIPGGGPLRFCASDRLRPASVRAPEPDEPLGILIIESTAIKRRASYDYRQSLRNSLVWRKFEQLVPEADRERWRESISETQDLSRISVQARPKGYVALVYADGDGVGKILRKVVQQHSFEGYQWFSELLETAANDATA